MIDIKKDVVSLNVYIYICSYCCYAWNLECSVLLETGIDTEGTKKILTYFPSTFLRLQLKYPTKAYCFH